ncbi:uncharacterized protein TNCV_2050611 [Trichonephila clavipes]|nr:uncharacterized protein TNCV_2050611 [Trichonephila clavipes]
MRQIMGICRKIVNSIRERSLQRRMFRAQLEENESDYEELLYHADVRWLSRRLAEVTSSWQRVIFFSNIILDITAELYGDYSVKCPFSSTTYGKCARRLNIAYTLASENIYAEIHREIKHAYKNGAEITDLSVSFDGTWLTHGQTSLIDVGCIIDMLTGYVVDFGVMSKVYVVIPPWQKTS